MKYKVILDWTESKSRAFIPKDTILKVLSRQDINGKALVLVTDNQGWTDYVSEDELAYFAETV